MLNPHCALSGPLNHGTHVFSNEYDPSLDKCGYEYAPHEGLTGADCKSCFVPRGSLANLAANAPADVENTLLEKLHQLAGADGRSHRECTGCCWVLFGNSVSWLEFSRFLQCDGCMGQAALAQGRTLLRQPRKLCKP